MTKKADDFKYLLASAQSGDEQALAKLLTKAENLGIKALLHEPMIKPAKAARRIGITGPPGAGKSTLISQLLERYRNDGLRIAVLAVDPTSPFSHGAILGDRIRYTENAAQGVFIRSIATRGSFGGLSASAYPMLRVFDACGFDLVIIETVGVGQVEVDIMHVADHVVLVLVPESGDSVQAMKAGILEIADLYVVNKSDRPGAEALKREIENSLLLQSEINGKKDGGAEVLLSTATEGFGIEKIKAAIGALPKASAGRRRDSPERLRHEAMALLRPVAERNFQVSVQQIQTPADLARLAAGPANS